MSNPSSALFEVCRECGMRQPFTINTPLHETWCNRGRELKDESDRAIKKHEAEIAAKAKRLEDKA